MGKVLHGGCLCGFVRYEVDGEPLGASYCHCDDCRRATGGAYTVGVEVKAEKLRIICGEVKGHTVIADSGRKITREFCPQCGSQLITRAEKHPDIAMLKGGCIDEQEKVKPTKQIWTKCAVPWAYIDESLPVYPESGP